MLLRPDGNVVDIQIHRLQAGFDPLRMSMLGLAYLRDLAFASTESLNLSADRLWSRVGSTREWRNWQTRRI